jgi:cytochrome c oxidase subunit 2
MVTLFDPATSQGSLMGSVWLIFAVTALCIGAIVVGLIVFALVRWRHRSDALPPQFNERTALEIAYTVIPLMIVAALFWVTLVHEAPVDALTAHPVGIVDVTAFRWSWRFAYVGTQIQVAGTPQSSPQLVLPLGETTEIDLTSADVTHSFWVPRFLFKRDAIPGTINRFDLTPTHVGTFDGKCAQFCGLDHALMTFTVRVVTPDDYRRWLASAARS